MVSMNPGETSRNQTSTSLGRRPSTITVPFHPAPLNSAHLDMPAEVTPGSDRTWSASINAVSRARWLSAGCTSAVLMRVTPSATKPGSTRASRANDASRRVARKSTVRLKASCIATSGRRSRARVV